MFASAGAVLLGIALGLTNASAVRGFRLVGAAHSGWPAAHGVDGGIGSHFESADRGPGAARSLFCSASRVWRVGYFALGLNEDERAWMAGCCGEHRANDAPRPAKRDSPKSA